MRKKKTQWHSETKSVGGLPRCSIPIRVALVVGSVPLLWERVVCSVSDLLLDEGVLQSLVYADAFSWVQHQCALQQVLQLHYLLPLVLRQTLASY